MHVARRTRVPAILAKPRGRKRSIVQRGQCRLGNPQNRIARSGHHGGRLELIILIRHDYLETLPLQVATRLKVQIARRRILGIADQLRIGKQPGVFAKLPAQLARALDANGLDLHTGGQLAECDMYVLQAVGSNGCTQSGPILPVLTDPPHRKARGRSPSRTGRRGPTPCFDWPASPALPTATAPAEAMPTPVAQHVSEIASNIPDADFIENLPA